MIDGNDHGMDLEFFAWLYVVVLTFLVGALIIEKWRDRRGNEGATVLGRWRAWNDSWLDAGLLA